MMDSALCSEGVLVNSQYTQELKIYMIGTVYTSLASTFVLALSITISKIALSHDPE